MYFDVGAMLIAGSAAGGFVSAVLAIGALRDRTIPGAVPFGWLMVAAAGWCLLNIAWLTASGQAVATSVFLLIQLTSGLIVGLWVVFALTYTGRESWLTPARLAGLLLAPSIYAVLAITNPLHGLVTVDTVLMTENGQTLFVGKTGVVYTIQTIVSVGFVGAGYALFGEYLLRSRNLYRKQTFTILTAGLLTAGVQGLFVLGATPHPGVDVTPLTFALNGVLVGFVLFRYDFVSVSPLAGDLLVDELPDTLIVLDADGKILDYNGATEELLGTDQPGGEYIDDIAPRLGDNIERGEVFAMGESLAYYDPQISDVTDQHGEYRGELVVLRDVTGQQHRQERLETLQSATQQFIEAERPEAIARLAVDFSTGVLDQNAAVVFLLNDNGHLEPAATSDIVRQSTNKVNLYVDPEKSPENTVWKTFESGEQRVANFGNGVEPLETALMLPMGDHGVMAIAPQNDSYEDRQYAEILAHTTQVALEQVAREWELQKSQTSVERRNEQIEFFNGVLRHSLRNAMLVVQGRAEHLRETVADEQAHHVDSIITWCGKLAEMSDTIRDINETVTASEDERLEPISLSSVVDRAVESVDAEQPTGTVKCDIDDTQWVLANHLIEKVLTSVIENAIEHNTSEEPRVEIGTQDAGDWIQLRVGDNGPGISDELKATMFERSITPDQTAGGFGLYFVSVMMDLYGGKVWYEDNDPTGTVAVLEFQRPECEPEDISEIADAATGKAQSKSPDN